MEAGMALARQPLVFGNFLTIEWPILYGETKDMELHLYRG